MTTPFNVCLDVKENVTEACYRIKRAKEEGAGMIIFTGAGMSVSSGVPVFRNADGSMSPEFLAFLEDYNKARKAHGLTKADNWFAFSVPEMFQKETEAEAWKYWRWRILRALVQPGEDYKLLMKLTEYFGEDRIFVCTSNCDMLHERAGFSSSRIEEIHGSLGRLQCANCCCEDLYPVDEEMLEQFRNNENFYPKCPKEGCGYCLRPNVMIFGDNKLVLSHLLYQEENFKKFKKEFLGDNNYIVLEIGAGVVVPSIRYEAEKNAKEGGLLIRINPSVNECSKMQSCYGPSLDGKYLPLPSLSHTALELLLKELKI